MSNWPWAKRKDQAKNYSKNYLIKFKYVLVCICLRVSVCVCLNKKPKQFAFLSKKRRKKNSHRKNYIKIYYGKMK